MRARRGTMNTGRSSRREFLRGAGFAAGAVALGGLGAERLWGAAKAPTSPVALARCTSYDLDGVLKQVQAMTDQLGGLKRLAAGKTVAVKVNLTGHPSQPAVGLPAN